MVTTCKTKWPSQIIVKETFWINRAKLTGHAPDQQYQSNERIFYNKDNSEIEQ